MDPPYPSWSGASMAPMRFITAWLAVLAINRRSMHPTAIGLTAPSFLLSAVSDAPKKTPRAWAGLSPARTRLVKVVRARSSASPSRPAEVLVRSTRCWDLRLFVSCLGPGFRFVMSVNTNRLATLGGPRGQLFTVCLAFLPFVLR